MDGNNHGSSKLANICFLFNFVVKYFGWSHFLIFFITTFVNFPIFCIHFFHVLIKFIVRNVKSHFAKYITFRRFNILNKFKCNLVFSVRWTQRDVFVFDWEAFLFIDYELQLIVLKLVFTPVPTFCRYIRSHLFLLKIRSLFYYWAECLNVRSNLKCVNV